MRKIGACAIIASLAFAACQDATVGPTAPDSNQPRISGVPGGLAPAVTTVTRGFGCGLFANGFSAFTTNSVSIQDSPTTSTLICDFVLPVEQRPVFPVTIRNVLCGTFTGNTNSSVIVASPSGFARLQCFDGT